MTESDSEDLATYKERYHVALEAIGQELLYGGRHWHLALKRQHSGSDLLRDGPAILGDEIDRLASEAHKVNLVRKMCIDRYRFDPLAHDILTVIGPEEATTALPTQAVLPATGSTEA